jgi:hypothetical protein
MIKCVGLESDEKFIKQASVTGSASLAAQL